MRRRPNSARTKTQSASINIIRKHDWHLHLMNDIVCVSKSVNVIQDLNQFFVYKISHLYKNGKGRLPF